jgi:hypothetical protein
MFINNDVFKVQLLKKVVPKNVLYFLSNERYNIAMIDAQWLLVFINSV